ncbi:MAG TPA: hypothetical protein VEV85_24130 [Bryobacteraceae bacterium]|nr:hypothetical protein [Bryobacteraceae bacterium]
MTPQPEPAAIYARQSGTFDELARPRSAAAVPLLGLMLAVIAANSAGNFALRVGMQQVGRTVSLSPIPYLAAMLNGWVLAGVFLLIGWLILQLSLLSRADLAYVLPVTAMANTVAAVLGAFVLYEPVSLAGWAGIGLICVGACLVAQTDSRTDAAGLTPSSAPEPWSGTAILRLQLGRLLGRGDA